MAGSTRVYRPSGSANRHAIPGCVVTVTAPALGYESVTYALDAIDTTRVANRTTEDTPISVMIKGVLHSVTDVTCTTDTDGNLQVIINAD